MKNLEKLSKELAKKQKELRIKLKKFLTEWGEITQDVEGIHINAQIKNKTQASLFLTSGKKELTWGEGIEYSSCCWSWDDLPIKTIKTFFEHLPNILKEAEKKFIEEINALQKLKEI